MLLLAAADSRPRSQETKMNTQLTADLPQARFFSKRTQIAALLAVPVLSLSGCYIVPVAPDGTPVIAAGVPHTLSHAPASGPAYPVTLNVRLYPANDIATPGGVLTGQVTNLLGGRGRFQFNYQGETLVGEATRVSGDERRGIASAYGQRGTHASCEYQMSSPTQGAGTCSFSNGAKYDVHVGG
jgi:hypothetical protein